MKRAYKKYYFSVKMSFKIHSVLERDFKYKSCKQLLYSYLSQNKLILKLAEYLRRQVYVLHRSIKPLKWAAYPKSCATEQEIRLKVFTAGGSFT